MKHIISLLLLLAMPMVAAAQELGTRLRYERIEHGTTVFPTAGEWAGITIQCKKANMLRFSSNVDKQVGIEQGTVNEALLPKSVSAIIYRTYEEGDNMFYDMMMRTNSKYANRMLYVESSGYSRLTIPLSNLEKKNHYHFRIYDPADINDGTCYQEHDLKGKNFFNSFRYKSAREEFVLAHQCVEATEEQKAAAQMSIADCDSIIAFIARGNAMAKEKMFDDAIEAFVKASNINPYDQYLANRLDYCLKNLNTLCSIYKAEGDKAFINKDYSIAKTFYQMQIDNGCDGISVAKLRIEECELLMRKRANAERYFGIDFGKTTGFTYGSFGHHVGSYVSMRTNREALEMARFNYDVRDRAMLDLTLGANIPLISKNVLKKTGIFRGAWLSLGLGTTVINQYNLEKNLFTNRKYIGILSDLGVQDRENVTQEQVLDFIEQVKALNDKDSEYINKPNDVLVPKLNATVNGELALTVKVWHVGARLSYCRRAKMLGKGLELDDVGKSDLFLGIGFCW